MNRTDAAQYIRDRPQTFGTDVERVLAQVRSSNDPDFYDPTLYTPEQGKTKIKASVAAKSAAQKAVAKVASPTQGASMTAGVLGGNSLPVLLAMGLLALGAGMTLYRVSR